MRQLGRAGLVALMLAGCGGNPLLKMEAADYAPLQVGSQWTYVDASGAAIYSTQVLATYTLAGVAIYSIDNYAGIPGISSVFLTGSAIIRGGAVDRKLPYVTGNKWELPAPPNVTIIRSVDGFENINTPAGNFVNCFRLKTETMTYDASSGLTATVTRMLWAAPNVGDVQYADADAAGNLAVTARLGSYSLGK